MSYTKKKNLWGVIFLIPWLIGVTLFFLRPLIKTFYYSLFNMTLGDNGFDYTFVGIDNFRYALTVNPTFNQGVLEALAMVARNVPFQIFVSLFVAILLNGRFKGRSFFRLIFFIPIILATGITQIEVSGIGIAEEEITNFVNMDAVTSIIAMSGIPNRVIMLITEFVDSIFEVITTSGVQMLIFLAGLQAISPTLYEVAKIEGCTGFESFCKITLPMISPMILVCMIYSLADTFAGADISDTIYDTTFKTAQYGLGAAMSGIYFAVSIFVILVLSFAVSKGVFYYDK